jgi:UDP-N-acetylglucosamine 2-epimerase (non-hydrolysing)
MIDSMRRLLPAARARRAPERFGVERGGYAVATIHRPSNVDDPAQLSRVLEALRALSSSLPVILPVHPRTAARIAAMEAAGAPPHAAPRLSIVPPLGYLDFLGLMDAARLVLTDSGGVQEETTALGVRCITLRDTTERPITMSEGTNRLIGSDPAAILPAAGEALAAGPVETRMPALWDGRAGERIAAILAQQPALSGSAPREKTATATV